MEQDAPTRGHKLGHTAHSYDRFAFTNMRARKVLEVFPVRTGDKVLDVGCGTGTLAVHLAKAVGNEGYVAAIDPAAAMVKATRHKADEAGCEIDGHVAAIEALPFEDASFDRVYSTLMLHHLPAETLRAGLAEVLRVLMPGGLCCVVDFGGLIALLLRRKSWIAKHLEAAGFCDVESVGRHFVVAEMLQGRRPNR